MTQSYSNLIAQAFKMTKKNYFRIIVDVIRYTVIMWLAGYLISMAQSQSSYTIDKFGPFRPPFVNGLLIMRDILFDFCNGQLTHKLGIIALIILSSIQLVGQSRYLQQTLRGQKASLIDACTHGLKQYRWVNAIPLMVFELLVPYLIANVTFGILFIAGMGFAVPRISATEILTIKLIAMGIIMILWIPCLWITSISYYGYYLIAEQNLGGLTLYKEAYKISRRAGMIKTLLLRCLCGYVFSTLIIFSDMPLLKLWWWTYPLAAPTATENLMNLIYLAGPILIVAPFSLAINAVMYENHKATSLPCKENSDDTEK